MSVTRHGTDTRASTRSKARLDPPSPWQAPPQTLRHATVGLGLLLFLLIGLDVHFGGAIVQLDRAVGQWVHGEWQGDHAFWRDVMSAPGHDPILYAVLALGAASLAALGRWRTGLLFLLSGLVLMTSVWTLKGYVAAERPNVFFDASVLVGSHSFPSGHTTNATLTYGLLAYLLLYARVSRGGSPDARLRGAAIAVWLVLALATGIARVLGGVHWPSDVVAGWALALAWLAGSISVHEHWVRPFEQLAAGRRPSHPAMQ